MKKVAVLVSQKGTTLDYLIGRNRESGAFCIPLVVADNPCPALDVARRHGLSGLTIRYTNREGFGQQLLSELDLIGGVDLIVMAGFMRILPVAIIRRYEGRVLNSHPSLLPAFPGMRAIRDQLNAKPRPQCSGCSIIEADEGVDTGFVLAQESVPIRADDTEADLRARIQEVEKPLYFEIICEKLRCRTR
jgi:phosphoribosylglycinamide formyltransferase-1